MEQWFCLLFEGLIITVVFSVNKNNKFSTNTTCIVISTVTCFSCTHCHHQLYRRKHKVLTHTSDIYIVLTDYLFALLTENTRGMYCLKIKNASAADIHQLKNIKRNLYNCKANVYFISYDILQLYVNTFYFFCTAQWWLLVQAEHVVVAFFLKYALSW
jgi:hypothetical protein